MAQRVRALGADRGVRVLLTREDDRQVSLMQRAAFANGAGAAVFISLHANAGPSPVSSGRGGGLLRRRPTAGSTVDRLPRIERCWCP